MPPKRRRYRKPKPSPTWPGVVPDVTYVPASSGAQKMVEDRDKDKVKGKVLWPDSHYSPAQKVRGKHPLTRKTRVQRRRK